MESLPLPVELEEFRARDRQDLESSERLYHANLTIERTSLLPIYQQLT